MFERGYSRVEIRPADSNRAADEFIEAAEQQVIWELGVRAGHHIEHCGVRIFREQLEITKDNEDLFRRVFTFITRGERVLAMTVEKALASKEIANSVSTITVYLGLVNDEADRSDQRT